MFIKLLSRIHNMSFTSTYFGLDSCECEYLDSRIFFTSSSRPCPNQFGVSAVLLLLSFISHHFIVHIHLYYPVSLRLYFLRSTSSSLSTFMFITFCQILFLPPHNMSISKDYLNFSVIASIFRLPLTRSLLYSPSYLQLHLNKIFIS
jgi:hypothetical protein